MKKLHLSTRIYIRYTLFQIPGLILLILILTLARKWVNLPAWFFWGTIAVWLTKDLLLFPFVWRAYEPGQSKDLDSLVGVEGIVEERLDPSGYIRVHGELWRAEVVGTSFYIERGKIVRIKRRNGLKLFVNDTKTREEANS